MKKIFAILMTLMLCTVFAFTGVSAFADAPVDDTPDFADNFESYSVGGYIEDDKSFAEKWDNEKIRFENGDTSAANDTECTGKAKIIEDPTAAGNKVMYIDTETDSSSFFYVGLKDIRTKEFELSYKMYSFGKNSSWFGTLTRKAANVRYNGTSNMMFTLLVSGKGDDGAKIDAITNVAYRNYGGASAPLDITDKFEGSHSVFSEDENYLFYKQWITVKQSVKLNADGKTVYKTSVTDKNGTVYDLGTITYSAKSVDVYGYVSFASCVAKTYIDDVVMTNLDTEPAPSEGDPTTPPETDTPVTNVVFDKTDLSLKVGNSATIAPTVYPESATDKTLTWTTSDASVATVSDAGVVTAVKAGTATITATAKSGVKRNCEVTVEGDNANSSETNNSSTGKTSSCGGVTLEGMGIISVILALSALVIFRKK